MFSLSNSIDLLNLKTDYNDFVDFVLAKQYSQSHQRKLLSFSKKLSNYVYFNYDTLKNMKERFCVDGLYKVSRVICHFYEDKYEDNADVAKELNRIRRLIKKPKIHPDIYTPTAKDVLKSLEKLREINPKYAQFYLGLALSGVRIVELLEVTKLYGLRVISNNEYYKIVLNSSHNTKNSYFVYLPNWYRIPKSVSLGYFHRLLIKNKDIIRPKYLRNFFYSICVELGISTAIADFYQGRTPITMGNKHYLEKEYHADREYLKLIVYFEQNNWGE